MAKDSGGERRKGGASCGGHLSRTSRPHVEEVKPRWER